MAKEKLTVYEKKYIELFGKLYEKRGQTKALGQVYAVLAYKAQSPENGLEQQEIAAMVDRSVSAVSRLLNKLVEMKFCNFVEEMDKGRRKRKYYMTVSFKEIAIGRFYQIIKDNLFLREELEKIPKNLPKEEIDENKELIEFLERMLTMIDKMNEFYKKAIGFVEELLDNL
ncbi:MAG: hypothetical protein ACFFC7_06865 [Candidatus Hermodarchaeota archaeon]